MLYYTAPPPRTDEDREADELSMRETLREMELDMHDNRVCGMKQALCSSHGFAAIGTKYLEAEKPFGAPQRTLTLLHVAAERGNLQSIRFLIAQGVPVDVHDAELKTPLYYAVCADQLEAAKLLVGTFNASIYPTRGVLCREPAELVYCALSKNHNHMVMFLLTCCGKWYVDHDDGRHHKTVDLKFNRESIVMLAAKLRNMEMVNFLIRGHVKLDVKDPCSGRNLAMMMVICGHTDILKFFIRHNVDINLPDNSGMTCLHFAAVKAVKIRDATNVRAATVSWGAQDNVHMLQTLLAVRDRNTGKNANQETDDNLNPVDYRGLTPLHLAASYDSREVAAVLIKAGASIGLGSEKRMTPLHYAVANNHVAMAKLLIEAGADILAIDVYGRTAMSSASNKGSMEIVEMLLALRPSILRDTVDTVSDAPLALAVRNDHRDVALTLIEYGADIDCIDRRGRTALSVAIRIGSVEMVVLLLKKGASVILPSADGARRLSTEVDLVAFHNARNPDGDRIHALLSRVENEIIEPIIREEQHARPGFGNTWLHRDTQVAWAADKMLQKPPGFQSAAIMKCMSGELETEMAYEYTTPRLRVVRNGSSVHDRATPAAHGGSSVHDHAALIQECETLLSAGDMLVGPTIPETDGSDEELEDEEMEGDDV
jgi:ankyrin repeat protein